MDTEEQAARALIGTTIADKYRVLDVLGAGGMGTVYLAEHVFTKRRVALKRMHPQLGRSKDAAERFIRESQAPSTIGHPGIVQVLDGGSQPDGSLYIVHELLEGVSMAEAVAQGTLSASAVIQLGIELLQALAAAHAKGIVHRDIKPDNVFIAQDGSGGVSIKLLDFGIASLRDTGGSDKLTRPGSVLGTAQYMSPEQAMADPVDERSDLWSVGALLYHALSGQLPYPGDSYGAVIYALGSKQHIPLAAHRPDLPDTLVNVVERALCKPPAERFASATQMCAALAAVSLEGANPDKPATRASAHTRAGSAALQLTAAARARHTDAAPVQHASGPGGLARSAPAASLPVPRVAPSLLKLSALAGTMLLCTLVWLMVRERDLHTHAAFGQLTAADALRPENRPAPSAPLPPTGAPSASPLSAAEAKPPSAPPATSPTTAEATHATQPFTGDAITAPSTETATPPSAAPTRATNPPLTASAASNLTTGTLTTVLASRQPELERCLQEAVVAQLLAGATNVAAYRLDVSLRVAASGQVESAELAGPAPADLSSCLRAQLMAAKFPQASAPTEFHYPLVLTPSVVGQ